MELKSQVATEALNCCSTLTVKYARIQQKSSRKRYTVRYSHDADVDRVYERSCNVFLFSAKIIFTLLITRVVVLLNLAFINSSVHY